MIKNKLLKKFISYIIIASFILSLLPTVSFAAEDTVTPVIYDAYISGNFVTGETLTANYSFDNPNVDTAKTNATIKWYAESRFGTSNSKEPLRNLTIGDDKTKYIIADEAIPNANAYSIYFEVTPKNASNETIGKKVYSAIGTKAVKLDNSSTALPTVKNAMIVPQNVAGTTLVGDTLAARYSYICINGSDLKSVSYQWYTGTTMSSQQATAIEGATSETYTVRSEDMGKWIFVKITPTAENNSVGDAVITKTHLGNAFRYETAVFDTTRSSGIKSYNYDLAKIIADGTTDTDNTNRGNGFIGVGASTALKTAVIDVGTQVPFNGIYLNLGSTSTANVGLKGRKISYSPDGSTWTLINEEIIPSDKYYAAGYNRGEFEYSFSDKLRYARYFKIEIDQILKSSNSSYFLAIHDFYPFVTNKALPKITLQGEDEVSLLTAPDAPAYVDAGYLFSNTPEGYSDSYIKENFITCEITDKDGNPKQEVVTTEKGEYNLTYTLAMPGLDPQTITRKIVVGNGRKTPGNLAYYYEDDKNEVIYNNMIDKNSIEGAPTINDGNENTVCEITSDGGLNLPASAVIEVKDTESAETYVSQFVIYENGSNIEGYNIYASEDGINWGEPVTTGISIGDRLDVILSVPVKANYVKLEITAASGTAQIKEMEVFLDDYSKIFMAKEKILASFEESVKALNHRDGYIYKNLPLVTEGIYGTKAKWTVTVEPADAAYADNVNGELKISRQEEETEFNLELMVEFTDEEKGGIYSDEELTQTIAKKSAPKARDVHITGNFVMGQTLTIPNGYYYDEAGVPEDKSATVIKWYRANKWGSTDKNQGYLSATLPSTSSTYTISAGDVYDANNLYYNIYASITPASMADDDAKIGAAYLTLLYSAPSTVSGEDAPTVSTPYISTLSEKGTMLAGDTVKVHYAYINRGEVAEKGTSYRWQTRASLTDNPTILTSDSPLNKTYTLTQADFGKWIECVITPKSASGAKGSAVIARNYYGNAFLAHEAVSYGTSGLRGKPSINAIKVMAYHDNAYLYGSGSGEDKGVYSDAVTGETKESFTKVGGDAGSIRPFNAFYVKIGGVAFNDLEFFYKVNDADEWTKLDIIGTKDDLAANTSAIFELDGGAKLGRYFMVRSKTASGYAELYGFFPCLTQSAGAYMEFPEDLKIAKGDMSFNVNNTFITAKDAVGNDAVPSISGSVNVNTVGEYPVTYTIETPGDTWFPTYSVTKTFTVVDGIKSEGDEAFGSVANATNGSGASNLTDGNSNTSWTGEGSSADIVIDLGSTKAISEIKLTEETSNITNTVVYTSANGTDWIAADVVASSDGVIIIEAVEAKYVKLNLSYSSAPTVSAIEVSADENAKAQLAIAALSLPSSVSSDIALVEKGLYNMSFSWLTNNPGVITADGSVTRQTSDTVVTLTARIMDGDSVLASRSFHITVLKKQAQQSQGSSNGGSGSAGSFGVSGPAPAPTPVTPSTQPSYNYKNFADVPETHWAADFVNNLYESGVISGRGNGSFEPEAQITRAEYLKLIVGALKLTAENEKADFTDVSENDWFFSYVAVANTLGIAKGNDGFFNPNEPILRRDMAVIAQRALAFKNITLKKVADVSLSDISSVVDYAKEAVELLSSAGIINGNENREFMPDKNATRAETAKIIYMLLENIK